MGNSSLLDLAFEPSPSCSVPMHRVFPCFKYRETKQQKLAYLGLGTQNCSSDSKVRTSPLERAELLQDLRCLHGFVGLVAFLLAASAAGAETLQATCGGTWASSASEGRCLRLTQGSRALPGAGSFQNNRTPAFLTKQGHTGDEECG